MTISAKAYESIKVTEGSELVPFSGKPSICRTSKPSFKARMRRLGIAPGVDTLLRGYLDETPTINLFTNKIL